MRKVLFFILVASLTVFFSVNTAFAVNDTIPKDITNKYTSNVANDLHIWAYYYDKNNNGFKTPLDIVSAKVVAPSSGWSAQIMGNTVNFSTSGPGINPWGTIKIEVVVPGGKEGFIEGKFTYGGAYLNPADEDDLAFGFSTFNLAAHVPPTVEVATTSPDLAYPSPFKVGADNTVSGGFSYKGNCDTHLSMTAATPEGKKNILPYTRINVTENGTPIGSIPNGGLDNSNEMAIGPPQRPPGEYSNFNAEFITNMGYGAVYGDYAANINVIGECNILGAI